MSLGEHMEELRRRLLYALLGVAAGMLAGLALARPLIGILIHPYRQAMEQIGKQSEAMTVLSVSGGMDTYMRVSLHFGVLVACPWIIYQAWAFVAAGLHRKEKRAVYLAVPSCVLLFVTGAAFFFSVVAVPVTRYLVEFNEWMGLRTLITLTSQISFMMKLMIAFGLAFQTPLAVLLLAKLGLVGMAGLRKYRRHAIAAIVILAAVIGPGDIPTMMALALPMWGLYELGVLLAYLVTRKERKEGDADEADAG